MVSQEVRTRTSVCHVDEQGIFRIVMLPGVEETIADAQEAMRAVEVLRPGGPRPTLVDIRGMKSQDREARQFYGSPEVAQHNTAVALLVGSRLSMLVANFFMSMTKSTVPTKMFTDEAEAVERLKGMRK